MTDGSRKAIFAAFFANLGIAVSKFVGFLLTGSASLLAETVHSLADTGNQALLFLGGKRAKREATTMHPFGYGRERYFWAFAVALVLFSMGGMFALYEGIEKLRHPHEVESIPIAVAILLIAIALESWSLRTAVRESRHVKAASTSWWGFIRTTRQPELPVVLLEDLGALIGLFVALIGVGLAGLTGNPRFDAAGSVTIGVLLIVIAIVLATEMKSLLIGESATEGETDSIVAAIESAPSVNRLIHMRTEHLGPDEILVGAKVEFAASLSAPELIDALNAAEDLIRAAVPTATVIYLEPDRFVPEPSAVTDGVTGSVADTQPAKRPKPLGLMAMLIAIVSFSISSPLIKWSGETGSVIAFWRMVGAFIMWWTIMMVIKLRTHRHFPTKRTWVLVLPAALFFGANIATFFTAITKTSIANAEFIGAMSPLLLLPAGAVFYGEHPNWKALRWGGLSIVGMTLVLFFGPANGTSTTAGNLLMLLVLAFWVAYLLLSKRARLRGVGTVEFMVCLAPLGLLTAGPIAAAIAGDEIFGLGPRGWLVVVILTLLTGVLAHALLVFAQKLIPIATIGVMQSAQPALAVFWGIIILGETVSGAQVVGMALVVIGLGLFTWSSQRTQAAV